MKNKSNFQSGLRSLLGQMAPEEFLRVHWARRHLLCALAPEVVAQIRGELRDCRLSEIVMRHRGKVQAWFQTLEGQHEVIEPSRREAMRLYESGMTLYLHQASTPALRRWQRTLARELGHFAGRVTFSLFAARRGAKNGCHFDSLENFTIQLRGEKRWLIAPNRHVAFPTSNQAARGLASACELELYDGHALPRSLPDDSETIDLAPGSMLYIPRGYWHATETIDDSLSVFLGFEQAPWADLLSQAVRSLLLQDPRWRQNVLFSADAQGRAEALRQLGDRMSDLGRILTALRPEDLLAAVDGSTPPAGAASPAGALRRNPLATMTIETPKDAGEHATIRVCHHLGYFGRTVRARIDPALVSVSERISRERGSVTAAQLSAQLPSVPLETLTSLLAALHEMGFLCDGDSQSAKGASPRPSRSTPAPAAVVAAPS